jgi:hypothetical protein
MTYIKTIVCLAVSRKPPAGRCVAGREIHQQNFGEWIRPVSQRPTREISEEERRFENGSRPAVLDVLQITMRQHMPERHQQENHEIDADYYWQRKRRVDWDELQEAVEQVNGPLWINGMSTYNGINDQVEEAQLAQFDRSLYLIRPENLRLIVSVDGAAFGNPRRRVRADFTLSEHHYRLVVTDPPMEEHYLRHVGEYPLAEALVCVSLGDVHNGYAYKLAAAVITPQRAGR